MEEYLDFYGGEGCQHVALATNDIVDTVTQLQNRGIEFLKVPSTYYDDLLQRVGHIDEDLEPLKQLGILVDRDNEGYLYKYLPSPWKIALRSFSKLFNAKGQKVLARGTLKHCSRP